ncbi:MAG: hypothetical protein AAF485_18595 [Chloroflexota bacterium]
MRLRKITLFGITLSFGLFLGLLLVELGLRLVPTLLPLETHSQLSQKRWLAPIGLPQFLAEYRQLWEDDAHLRERMKPDIDTVVHGNPEYPSWVIRTDSLNLGPAGFRDTLPNADPYALILGDSFGFGVGVAQEDLWLEQLEVKHKLPFVNLSQVGASSIQESLIYEYYGQQLPTKVVFWMFFQNDLKDNLRFAQWQNPQITIPQAARLPTQNCSALIHRVLKRYSLAYELFLYSQQRCHYSALIPPPVYQDNELDLIFCLDHDICDLQVQADMLANGWPFTQQALLEARTAAEQIGAIFVIVIVPSKEQVYWEQFEQVSALPDTYDINQLVNPVLTLCAAEGLNCLDLAPPLREEAQKGQQLYFPVDIHWNEAGHRVVADAVEQFLHEKNLLP